MAGSEEGARREAVRRVMAGEAVAAVAASMGRSKPWVRKWVARYDPTDPAWAAERSRAPGVVANRTDAETEALVVKVRQRLADQAWAQTGPAAIAWELTRLGEDPPDLRTIARILARHDQPRSGASAGATSLGARRIPPRRSRRPTSASRPTWSGPATSTAARASTPSTPSTWPGARPVGPSPPPRAPRRCVARCWPSGSSWACPPGCSWTTSKAWPARAASPARSCASAWPTASPRCSSPSPSPGATASSSTTTTPSTSPSPRAERFPTPGHVADRYRAFLGFHNARHRYSALAGHTPDQAEAQAGFAPTWPRPDLAVPERFDGLTGRVEYIRLIRSDATCVSSATTSPCPTSSSTPTSPPSSTSPPTS